MTELRLMFTRPIPKDSKYESRIEEEFALIERNKFTRVFLQVQQIMNLCKKLQIPHIIRGSAGSSLVCYLMGISHTDPMKYDMDLARFMNHGRTDLPDIDIDVPYNRRDELYAEIGKTWRGKVARISNHVLYQYRSALQESLRKHAPKVQYKKNSSVDTLIQDPEIAAKVKESLYDMIGTLRTESLHCGGIVIFDKEGTVPADLILKEEVGKLPQIRLNKDETEDAGYIKIDILSNRGMAQWWEATNGTKHLLDYPKYDEEVIRLFSVGDTIGITFGESRGQRRIYKQLLPTGVDDIAIALALIRPAAAAAGRKSQYLTLRKTNTMPSNDLERPIVFDDDALARIRAVFRADGSSFPKETVDTLADRYRKAYSKQRIAECLQFRDICKAQGLPKAAIDKLIDDLNQLQHYSFCKSHALSYAQLVWALAWEKVHNPHKFWVATLNHCNSDYRKWVHMREARTSGLRLCRGAPPYKLSTHSKEPKLVSTRGEQLIFARDDDPHQMYRDMKQIGYWLGAQFFPGCYRRITKDKKDKTIIEFRGLVATGRVVHCDTDGDESCEDATERKITFICIGYENGKFMDLTVYGARGYLLGYAVVEGTAIQRADDEESLQVTKIKGVPLWACVQ